jgi:predicted enzyme related to lactoylglutathione lyase
MDLNQVTLEVDDFETAVKFYQTLGMRLIVSQGDEYARFELPSGSSTLSLHVATGRANCRSVIYFEVDDVDRTYAELTSRGVHFDTAPADQPWLWREARLKDPSGNEFCVYHAGLNRRFPPWRIE